MAIPFKYKLRSLLIRRVSNSMTVGAIAIVVAVFVAAMAIVEGLDSAIKDSSSPDNMILIGRAQISTDHQTRWRGKSARFARTHRTGIYARRRHLGQPPHSRSAAREHPNP